MKKLTILVDMDDTIENLLPTWVTYLNERYGTHVRADDIRQWDMSVAYPSLTKEQINAPLFDRSMWNRVEPLPHAIEYMRKLFDDGHDVFIVTSSHYGSVALKLENVLFRYFPFIDWKHVIVACNKQMIRGDVLIDDAPHNLIDGAYHKILMNAPHNQSFDEKKYGIHRVSSWPEIYTIVKRYAEEV